MITRRIWYSVLKEKDPEDPTAIVQDLKASLTDRSTKIDEWYWTKYLTPDYHISVQDTRRAYVLLIQKMREQGVDFPYNGEQGLDGEGPGIDKSAPGPARI